MLIVSQLKTARRENSDMILLLSMTLHIVTAQDYIAVDYLEHEEFTIFSKISGCKKIFINNPTFSKGRHLGTIPSVIFHFF